jgi:hypothetical protein
MNSAAGKNDREKAQKHGEEKGGALLRNHNPPELFSSLCLFSAINRFAAGRRG